MYVLRYTTYSSAAVGSHDLAILGIFDPGITGIKDLVFLLEADGFGKMGDIS